VFLLIKLPESLWQWIPEWLYRGQRHSSVMANVHQAKVCGKIIL